MTTDKHSLEGRGLSDRQVRILQLLSREQKLGVADRPEDRERQSLRRAGLIAYVGKPRRWQISAAGIAALKQAEESGRE